MPEPGSPSAGLVARRRDGAVDPLVEAEILDALRAELDMTVLVVAHRISTILLADTVVYLDDGRVVATGTHEELLQPTTPGTGHRLRTGGGLVSEPLDLPARRGRHAP